MEEKRTSTNIKLQRRIAQLEKELATAHRTIANLIIEQRGFSALYGDTQQ